MPKLHRVQIVLVEVAAAGAAIGLAVGGLWRSVGVAAAAVVLLLAVVPVRRRWLYQVGLARLAGLRRRMKDDSLAAVVGPYQVVAFPVPGQDMEFGVVHTGEMWTLPLEVTLDDLLNRDVPITYEQLLSLLKVEDVELSSVRMLTVTAPSSPPPGAPAGPARPANQLAARYLLLTLDAARAAEAIASRGGSEAAIAQILRRCALRAEQTLGAAGLKVRRLEPRSVKGLFPSLLGPSVTDDADAGAGPPGGAHRAGARGSGAKASVSWNEVRVSGTWSRTFVVAGQQAAERLDQFASAINPPMAVSAVLIRRQRRGAVLTNLLLRVSGPAVSPDRSVLTRAADVARAMGLVLQRLDGEQAALLQVTTPVGVGSS